MIMNVPHSMVMVLTSPRHDCLDYLTPTIHALDRVGANSLHRVVFSDGPESMPPYVEGWDRAMELTGPSGSLLGTWAAFSYFLHATSFENLLFFEDDILPCRNLIAKMILAGVPDRDAFVSYFDNNDFVLDPCEPPVTFSRGFHRYPGRGRKGTEFWHTQAMMIPRRFLTWLLNELPISEIRKAPKGTFSNADVELGRLVEKSPWPTYLRHYPCLVQHVGDVSRFGVTDLRRSANFVGEDFDALSEASMDVNP